MLWIRSSLLQNLFPVQIENRLTAHPQIREAAAVAVSDPTYGEVVGVWIVKQPSDEKSGESPLSRTEVRKWVSQGMNPQVSRSALANGSTL